MNGVTLVWLGKTSHTLTQSIHSVTYFVCSQYLSIFVLCAVTLSHNVPAFSNQQMVQQQRYSLALEEEVSLRCVNDLLANRETRILL